MYLVKAEANQIEKIVAMSVRAFETDVNVGGIKGDCPPEYDSIKWHQQMAREGHLYQAMIGNDLVGAAIVFPDETENSVYIGRIFIDSIYHRKGFGIRLMDCIEKNFPWAAEFHLDTPCWNERTNAFYKRLDYLYCKYTNVPSFRTAESIGMRFACEYPDEINGKTRVSVISREDWQRKIKKITCVHSDHQKDTAQENQKKENNK